MSDWKSRATKVAANDWKSRATAVQQEAPQKEEPGIGSKALDYTLRGMDYAGGLTRTAAAGLLGGTKDGDWENAFVGKAPGTDQYLEQLGVDKGGSLSDALPGMYSETGEGLLTFKKGGFLDPSARGAAGFVGDVLLDPLTYASGGTAMLAKSGKLGKTATTLDKAFNPLSKITESSGKSIYKSGLKRLDQEAIKYGKEPVSDVLMKYGVSGSYDSIRKKMDDIAGNLTQRQKGLLLEADNAGKKVDMSGAMKNAEDMIADIRASRNPELQSVADALEKDVQKYKMLDSMPTGVEGPTFPIGVQQANDFKTAIYEKLPKGAWAESVSGLDPAFLRGKKAQARGLKEGVEDAVAQIGKGDELVQINDELGRILTTREKATAEGFKEANKNAFTSVDAMIAGARNPEMLIMKKLADVAKMTGPRTTVGKAMYNAGRSQLAPLMDIAARRMAIEANYPEEQPQAPWMWMPGQQGE